MTAYHSRLLGFAFVLALAGASNVFAEFLYFADVFSPTLDDGRLQRIRTDGTELLRLAELDSGLRGLAIHSATEELFWSNVDSDTIHRVSVDDRVPRAVVSTGLEFPMDLSVDSHAARLVWLDALAETIESVALDGGDRQVLLRDVRGAAMAIDSAAGKIYFEYRIDAARGEIRRANIDGSQLETIVSDVPTASSLAVDPSSETVFWTSSAGLTNGNGGVYRVNFDGSGFEEIFVQGDNLDTSAAVLDATQRVLYFAQDTAINRSAIYRIGLDGSNPTLIASGFGNITHMVISSVEIDSIVPEPAGALCPAIVALLICFRRRLRRGHLTCKRVE